MEIPEAEIPEAAIKAAEAANAEAWDENFPDTHKGKIRSTLYAALPALREQWERELLSGESIERGCKARSPMWSAFKKHEKEMAREALVRAIRAALRTDGVSHAQD